MKEFIYDNAVIRISIPNKDQMDNIQKSTEIFFKKIIKEDIFQNGYGYKTRSLKEK